MVYKRYVLKDGKLHGPYYYESYRDDVGNVKKRYLGTSPGANSRNYLFILFFIACLVLIIGLFYFSGDFFVGKLTGFVSLGEGSDNNSAEQNIKSVVPPIIDIERIRDASSEVGKDVISVPVGVRGSGAIISGDIVRGIQGDISGCGDLNVANTLYTLTTDVSNDATCFNVLADNVTLDCQGYSINYSNVFQAYGVNNVGYNNTLIRNCVFRQLNESVLYSSAVYCSKVVNCTAQNVTIETHGNKSAHGINMPNSFNSSVTDSRIVTYNNDSYAIRYSVTNGGKISMNNISTFGPSSYGLGIYFYDSDNINISYNNVSGYGGGANNLFIQLTDNSIVLNNKFNTFTPQTTSTISYYGNNNRFISNNITSNSSFSLGIFVAYDGDNNVIENNTISTNEIGSPAISIQAVPTDYPENNNITNNRFIVAKDYDFFLFVDGINGTYLIDQPVNNYSIHSGVVYFKSSSFGEIRFNQYLNGSGNNLSAEVWIANNSIHVNGSNSGLNKSANVSLYGIGNRGFVNATIMRDGVMCRDCVNTTALDAVIVRFNVSSWGTSNYSIEDGGEGNAPLVTINVPVNTTYNSASISFNVSLNENGSVSFSLDGGATNRTMSTGDNRNFNYTNGSIPDGSYTFRVWANDTFGNRNYTENVVFVVDIVKPLINIIEPANISYAVNVSWLNYTYSDSNDARCWYSNNSGIWNSSSIGAKTNFTNIISIEGNNTWTLYCNDSAGNLNLTNVSFVKDTIAPFVVINSPLATTYSSTNVTINISSNGVYTWWFNESANLTYTDVLSAIYSDGSHTIFAYSNDSIGNSNSTSVGFTISSSSSSSSSGGGGGSSSSSSSGGGGGASVDSGADVIRECVPQGACIDGKRQVLCRDVVSEGSGSSSSSGGGSTGSSSSSSGGGVSGNVVRSLITGNVVSESSEIDSENVFVRFTKKMIGLFKKSGESGITGYAFNEFGGEYNPSYCKELRNQYPQFPWIAHCCENFPPDLTGYNSLSQKDKEKYMNLYCEKNEPDKGIFCTGYSTKNKCGDCLKAGDEECEPPGKENANPNVGWYCNANCKATCKNTDQPVCKLYGGKDECCQKNEFCNSTSIVVRGETNLYKECVCKKDSVKCYNQCCDSGDFCLGGQCSKCESPKKEMNCIQKSDNTWYCDEMPYTIFYSFPDSSCIKDEFNEDKVKCCMKPEEFKCESPSIKSECFKENDGNLICDGGAILKSDSNCKKYQGGGPLEKYTCCLKPEECPENNKCGGSCCNDEENCINSKCMKCTKEQMCGAECCKEGEACLNLKCVKCSQDKICENKNKCCKENEFCNADDKCVDDSCTSNYVSETLMSGECARKMQAGTAYDWRCCDNKCTRGKCGEESECKVDKNCKDKEGKICSKGKCVNKECDLKKPCENNMACINGRCVACKQKGDCRAYQECIRGRCIETGVNIGGGDDGGKGGGGAGGGGAGGAKKECNKTTIKDIITGYNECINKKAGSKAKDWQCINESCIYLCPVTKQPACKLGGGKDECCQKNGECKTESNGDKHCVCKSESVCYDKCCDTGQVCATSRTELFDKIKTNKTSLLDKMKESGNYCYLCNSGEGEKKCGNTCCFKNEECLNGKCAVVSNVSECTTKWWITTFRIGGSGYPECVNKKPGSNASDWNCIKNKCVYIGGDDDGDGIPNDDDPDKNGDGIPDQPWWPPGLNPNGDVDGDGIININDSDINGDGILNGDDPTPAEGIGQPGTGNVTGNISVGNVTGNVSVENISLNEEITEVNCSVDICVPNWECGGWGVCSAEGYSERKCLDSNSCNVSGVDRTIEGTNATINISVINSNEVAERMQCRVVAGNVSEVNGTIVEEGKIIESCGALNQQNTNYILSKDITGDRTCIVIGANNVSLNCKGHKITYGKTKGYSYGVDDRSGYDKLSIKNCTIEHGGYKGQFFLSNYGIYLVRVSESLIKNVVIRTGGEQANIGLVMFNSVYNEITDTSIYTNGDANFISQGYGIMLGMNSDNNNFSKVNIVTNGNGGGNDGLQIVNSSHNKFYNIDITTSGLSDIANDGIVLKDDSGYNKFYSPNINVKKGGSHGIYVENSDNNEFYLVDVVTSGEGSFPPNRGIRLSNAKNNNFLGGSVTTNSANSPCFLLEKGTINNTFADLIVNPKVRYSGGFYYLTIDQLSEQESKNRFINNKINDANGVAFRSHEAGEFIFENQIINSYWFEGSGVKLSFENPLYGGVEFLEPISGQGYNLDKAVRFGDNYIFVNVSAYPFLNKQAIIILYNIRSKGFVNPVILRDNKLCVDCVNLTSLDGDIVKFKVNGFSSYSIGGGNVIHLRECGELRQENTLYILDNNVSTNGTCFNIRAENVILDCRNYNIKYVGDPNNVIVGYLDRAGVKNCVVVRSVGGGEIVEDNVGYPIIVPSQNSIICSAETRLYDSCYFNEIRRCNQTYSDGLNLQNCYGGIGDECCKNFACTSSFLGSICSRSCAEQIDGNLLNSCSWKCENDVCVKKGGEEEQPPTEPGIQPQNETIVNRTNETASQCISNIQCGEWGECNSATGYKTRTCNDRNNCVVSYTETDACAIQPPGEQGGEEPPQQCIPNIECSVWGECAYGESIVDIILGIIKTTGQKTRTCNDRNNCVVSYVESSSCASETDIITNKTNGTISPCIPNVECSVWGECNLDTGYKSRTCNDKNKCNASYIESINCVSANQTINETIIIPIITPVVPGVVPSIVPGESGGGNELVLSDSITGGVVSRIDIDAWKNKGELDIAFVQSDEMEEAHCSNGILDGDEEKVDCGGSCIACKNRDIINAILKIVMLVAWLGAIILSGIYVAGEKALLILRLKEIYYKVKKQMFYFSEKYE